MNDVTRHINNMDDTFIYLSIFNVGVGEEITNGIGKVKNTREDVERCQDDFGNEGALGKI